MEILSVTNFMIIITLLTIYLLIKLINKSKNKETKHKIEYSIIETKDQLEDYVNLIYNNNVDIVGLDTEYFRGDEYVGKLCIIQMAATINNKINVVIIDLVKIDKFELAPISKILADPKIEKVIHSCKNDIEWIFDEMNTIVNNIFDTQEIFQFLHNKKKTGLNHLLNKYFDLALDNETKKQFQKSNWKHRPLTTAQLDYAAYDCYYLINLRNILVQELNITERGYFGFKASLQEKIQSRLISNKIERTEKKALNYFISNITKCDLNVLEYLKSLFLDIYRFNNHFSQLNNFNPEKILKNKIIYKIVTRLPKTQQELSFIIDSKYLEKLLKQNYSTFIESIFQKVSEFINKHKLESNFNDEEIEEIININNKHKGKSKLDSKKIKSREQIIQTFKCKKPIYENCQMQAPDGELLCYCDNKKMNWYLKRNLAKLISEDPPTFKLLFEPNARGCSDLQNIPSYFYLKYRKNCCVVCGNEENYMRFHVVPILYRKFFPEELKSHKSHDVVLLCFPCHEKANQIYDSKKKMLADNYNVPLFTLSDDQKEIKELEQTIRHAKTLRKNINGLPIDKKEWFTQEITTFLKNNKNNPKFGHFFEVINTKNTEELNKIEITNEILDKIKNYKYKPSSNFEKKNHHGHLIVREINDFTSFIRDWRIFFIESLNPKFLPDSWNVEHQFYRTFGSHSKFKNSIIDNELTNKTN